MGEQSSLGESNRISGVINGLFPKEKGPAGSFRIDDDSRYFTVWSSTVFNSLNEGQEVEFIFSHKQNEFNGKTYDNYIVDNLIDDTPESNVELNQETTEKIKAVRDQMDKTGKNADKFTEEETKEVIEKIEKKIGRAHV